MYVTVGVRWCCPSRSIGAGSILSHTQLSLILTRLNSDGLLPPRTRYLLQHARHPCSSRQQLPILPLCVALFAGAYVPAVSRPPQRCTARVRRVSSIATAAELRFTYGRCGGGSGGVYRSLDGGEDEQGDVAHGEGCTRAPVREQADKLGGVVQAGHLQRPSRLVSGRPRSAPGTLI